MRIKPREQPRSGGSFLLGLHPGRNAGPTPAHGLAPRPPRRQPHHLGTPSGPPERDLRLRQAPRAGAFQSPPRPRPPPPSPPTPPPPPVGRKNLHLFERTRTTPHLSVIPHAPAAALRRILASRPIVALMPLGGQNDRLTLIDTPADTLESVNFANLSVQARTGPSPSSAPQRGESTIDSTSTSTSPAPRSRAFSGATVQFKHPLGHRRPRPLCAGTYVYLPFTSGPTWARATKRAHASFRLPARGAVAHHPSSMAAIECPSRWRISTGSPRIFAYWLERDEAPSAGHDPGSGWAPAAANQHLFLSLPPPTERSSATL